MTDTTWRKPSSIVIIGLLLTSLLGVGCGKTGGAKSGPSGTASGGVGHAADMNKPFTLYTWQQSQNKEPLTFAKLMAHTAGGTWVALAPHPLEEVKWTPNMRGYPSTMKVAEILPAAQQAGTPLAWENRSGYTLLYFGPSVDMTRLRERAPQEVIGLMLVSDSPKQLVRAVEDLWRVKIEADPTLLGLREALLQARKPMEDDPENTSENMAGYMAPGTGVEATPMLEFKIEERTPPETLMEKLAGYLGGECKDLGGGKWRFSSLSRPEQIQEEIQKLRKTVEERTANATAGFTSFSERSGASGEEVEEVDPETEEPIPAIDDEAQDALDRLAMLGKPALDTLRDFLKPENPSLTRSALLALGAIKTPEASSAIVNFARDLPVRTTGKARTNRRSIAVELIRLLKRAPTGEYAMVLAEMARSADYSPETRLKARMALAASGNVTLLSAAKGTSEAPTSETSFHLVVPPAPKDPKAPVDKKADPGAYLASDKPTYSTAAADAAAAKSSPKQETPPDAVKTIATYTGSGGDTWAIFLSGRYGDSDDIWLARNAAGQWTDFLFTGRQFERGQGGRGYYGRGMGSKKGSCVLKVAGDQVTISPPDPAAAAELEKIQKAMADGNMKQEDRMKLNKRYSELYEKVSNTLKAPLSLSLAALQKDTDGDGLSDVLEERLALDPSRADTDGDHVPDGKDRCARTSPVKTRKEGNTLLDLLFTTLFAGDPSPEPIVIVLDRDHWQEFPGPSARLILVTKEEYVQRAKHLATLRTLQFGGPKDGNATILVKDGPCLFNDGKTRAEMHFWVQRSSQSSNFGYRGGGSGQTRDYVARFQRQGMSGWKLAHIKPWRYETADSAATEMQRLMNDSVDY